VIPRVEWFESSTTEKVRVATRSARADCAMSCDAVLQHEDRRRLAARRVRARVLVDLC